MNVTIINGSPDNDRREFEDALVKTVEKLSKNHNVDLFNTRDMKISYCCGCFSCWVKTPGLCIFKDDMEEILKSMAKTDYLLYVSPVISGFLSAETKKVMDRMLPNVLPYIRIFDGECHHPQRYGNKPNLGLLLFDDDNLDSEATGIIFDTIDRLSLNFHAVKTFKGKARANEMQEVILNEIGNC